MRNYLSTWWDYILWQSDTDLGAIYTAAGSPEEMTSRRQTNIDSAAAGQTNWQITSETGPFQAFMLLDKANILRFLQNVPDFVYITSLQNFDPAVQIVQFVRETPRYKGWTDEAGVKRAAPPSDKKGAKSDFSGAKGLIDLFNLLPAFAAQLKSQGKVREAGIVMYAYNQVLKLTWTITEALDYLRTNGIL